jgi:hypothetical protein
MRVFAYLIDPSKSAGNRQSPMSGVMVGTKQHIFAEIAFAPFGFVLTGDVEPINVDLLDITHLGSSSYHRCETIFMKIPVLQINTWLPGDFRSKEEVKNGRGQRGRRAREPRRSRKLVGGQSALHLLQ